MVNSLFVLYPYFLFNISFRLYGNLMDHIQKSLGGGAERMTKNADK